jgi:S-adenosylmethionine:tRNA ribosyltransferase-isomerase
MGFEVDDTQTSILGNANRLARLDESGDPLYQWDRTALFRSRSLMAELLSDYDYDLPEDLIAAEPAAVRDESRLLVVDRRSGSLSHHRFRDLPTLLHPQDRLVLNDTRVVPARLFGQRSSTGGKWEGLFLGTTDDGRWKLIGQTRGRLEVGETLTIAPAHDTDSGQTLELTLEERDAEGMWTATPSNSADYTELLAAFGTVPLPPYIRRKLADEQDWERYQTTYARRPGAVAAPTAGLHVTPQLLQTCSEREIEHSFVTLHVGIGTFRPIAAEKLADHVMHEEWCELSNDTAKTLNQSRQNGGRIVAVGTTSVRTMETAVNNDGLFDEWSGESNLFIRPPYTFRGVDCLVTNFHLPRSTLFVLVSTLAGRELIRHAYETAIEQRYRFFSYGDAMLIL